MGNTFLFTTPAATLFGICLLVFVSVALPAQAQLVGAGGPLIPVECRAKDSAGAPNPNFPGSCTLCHMAVLVMNLTDYLIYWVAFPAVVILVAIGGIMILIAGPSEERQAAGKKILTSTIVGLVIVFLSWLIVNTSIKLLIPGGAAKVSLAWWATEFGPWNEINIPATGCPL